MGSATAQVSHAALVAVPELKLCQRQYVSMQHGLCQKRKRSASMLGMAMKEDQCPKRPSRCALQPPGMQQQQHQQQKASPVRVAQPQPSIIISETTSTQLSNPMEKMLPGTLKVAVKAGTGVVQTSSMIDSTPEHAARNWAFLRQRLQQEGYLMIRNVLPSPQVMEARTFLLEELHRSKPGCFAPGTSPSEARAAEGARGLGLLGRQDLAAAPPVSAVLESPALFALMQSLMQVKDVITSGHKWLRGVAQSEFTGLHTDRVFLGRGTSQLLTAWLPLGAVGPDLGSLLVAAGSHRLQSFAGVRSTYGATQVGSDGTRSGWLSDNGAALSSAAGDIEVDWRIGDCRPGDVVILGLDVLHMSASNESSPPRIRLSCDTRWQPASEPRDPRLKVWHSQASTQE